MRLAEKNFEDEELPHELFLTRRQAIKVFNDNANNTSADIKFSKNQISSIINNGKLSRSKI